MKKQTQDLLQAELTNTLKRRKPIVINEPPKYQYPTYDSSNSNDNSIYNNNNNNNSSDDSSHSTSASVNNTSPLNVSAVLSAVTGIKLPDVQYDPNASVIKSQVADKQKISHGKPNFTINQKENTSTVQPIKQQTSPKLHVKTPEVAQSKFQRPSFFTNGSMCSTDKLFNKIPETKPSSNANSESQVDKCKSIFLIKSQKSIDNESSKPPKYQPKSDVVFQFDNGTSSNVSEQPKEILNRKNSVDDTINGIPFASVANKKALFEKPTQDASTSKTLPLKCMQTEKVFFNKPVTSQTSNGKFNTISSKRTINSSQQKPSVTTVSLNKNISYGTLDRAKLEQPRRDRVNHFERSMHTVDETSTTNALGQHETKYIEQKTFVSFSKDLLNAPNKYPEQIRVKKTVTNHSNAIAESPFHSIRFSIKTDGQVIPKAK